MQEYDIIVIGGGHAGSEAAAAAATMGSEVLLITMDMTKIAQMSCNPAMGGIAKGQILREIDALGGLSAIITDESTIQFRMLNRSKGPAMWSPRAQCDRMKFSKKWREKLENIKSLHFWQDTVVDILVKKGQAYGVRTRLGGDIYGKAVILTSGTFMNGLIHVGRNKISGGRAGEAPSKGLSERLENKGFIMGRMKTGTPVRIDGRTVDFSKLIEQKGDIEGGYFSFLNYSKALKKQWSCYIAHTDKNVHEILRKGIPESPLFNGTIKSIGPRYCPSIEDKIITFDGKEQHQLFLEPEGENTVEYYLNGFSSSLPLEIQIKALRQTKGFEKCKIFRPGYAIEYDYFDPTQLKHSLETKKIENLYFAGQVNGTTGYEEAGAQGIIAGINAHLKIKGKAPFILQRDEAYIGVLIDDLVTKGVDEPYRMFTSRAEYRILLRQDDADLRLTGKGYEIGLAKERRFRLMKKKYKKRDELVKILKKSSIKPETFNDILRQAKTSPLRHAVKAVELLKRPQVNIEAIIEKNEALKSWTGKLGGLRREILQSAEIYIKYAGYIEREKNMANKMKRLEYIKIPDGIRYEQFQSLSTEARQKLLKIKPKTLGQAARISGVSPADVSVLLIHLRQ